MADFALITGSTTGIGKELTELFARDRHNLVLVARNETKLQEQADALRERFGVEVHTLGLDLSLLNSAQELFTWVESRGLQISYLINNAGFGLNGAFSSLELQGQLDMMNLNMRVPVELSRLLLPGMRARNRGGILNVASTAAFQPGPYMAVYYATKSFLLFFSEALAEELRGTGIHVTVLCPGPTRTGFQERAGIQDTLLMKAGLMGPAPVAAAGYRGLMAGRRVVVPGLANRLGTLLVRLAPLSLATRVVAMLQRGRH